MRAFNGLIAAASAAVILGTQLGSARAAEIKLLSTIAMQSAIKELAPKFEKQSGHKLAPTFGLGVAMAKRVADGEAADVVIALRGGVDGLVKDGKVGSDVTLARSGIGVAVRKGSPKPDISTAEALKRTLLAAKSISYSDPAFGGASGVHFAKVIERLGIAEQLKPKTKYPPEAGSAGELLVKGDVDLAVQQIPELQEVTGTELVGPLPGDLQNITVFAAAIPAKAKEPNAAKAFIQFLQTPEAVAVIKEKGLEPG